MRLSSFVLISILSTLCGLALGWAASLPESLMWAVAFFGPFTIYGALSLAADLWEEIF